MTGRRMSRQRQRVEMLTAILSGAEVADAFVNHPFRSIGRRATTNCRVEQLLSRFSGVLSTKLRWAEAVEHLTDVVR